MTLLVLSMLVLGVVLLVATGLWSGWFALRSLGPAPARSSVRRLARGVYVALVGVLAMIAAFRGLTVLFSGPATAMTLGKALVIVGGIAQIAFAIRPAHGAAFDPRDRLPSLGLGALSVLAPEFLASDGLLVGAIAMHGAAMSVAARRSGASTDVALFTALVVAYGGLATDRAVDEVVRRGSLFALASVPDQPGCNTNG